MKLFHLQKPLSKWRYDMSECLTCETAFCKKAQHFEKFGSSDFDQISPACGKHSY